MALGINSDLTSLLASRNLYKSNRLFNNALQKLSSGLRINKGSDDPSGLIISELLRSQIGGYERALRNTQETNNVMSIAEGGLSSVSSMLTQMRSLAIHALNDGVTSKAQTNADQMEMNSLLQSINRVTATTTYAGKNLLDGSQNITFGTQDANSIIDPSGVHISSVNGMSTGDINISYGGAGEAAQAASVTADLSGALDADGNLAADAQLQINGATVNLTAGMSIEDMAQAINQGVSGATAYAERDQASGEITGLRIDSDTTGSASTVSVTQGGGIFAAGTAVGSDATSGTASQAERAYLEADFGVSTLSTAQEFTITGADGSRTFNFSAGTSIAEMAEQINNVAGSTGVNAYAIRNDGTGETALRLVSSEYGSDASVRVQQHSGNAFAQQGRTAVDYGQDASLVVNGTDITTNGLTADLNTGGVTGRVTFNAGDPDAATIAQTGYDQDNLVNAADSQSASVTNIKGGMQLQLGEGAGGQNRETISIGNYNPAVLGQVTQDGRTYSLNDLFGGGAASLANDPELALKVIDQAIADVSSGRANIGAYQANALETNANNLMVGIENLTATESSIRDTDMAEAMIQFIAAKLLQDASSWGVQSSNMNRRNVASLLGMG